MMEIFWAGLILIGILLAIFILDRITGKLALLLMMNKQRRATMQNLIDYADGDLRIASQSLEDVASANSDGFSIADVKKRIDEYKGNDT